MGPSLPAGEKWEDFKGPVWSLTVSGLCTPPHFKENRDGELRQLRKQNGSYFMERHIMEEGRWRLG